MNKEKIALLVDSGCSRTDHGAIRHVYAAIANYLQGSDLY